MLFQCQNQPRRRVSSPERVPAAEASPTTPVISGLAGAFFREARGFEPEGAATRPEPDPVTEALPSMAGPGGSGCAAAISRSSRLGERRAGTQATRPVVPLGHTVS